MSKDFDSSYTIESSEKDLSTKFKTFFDQLKPQDVVLLSGPIGGGKTTFVRSFVEAKSETHSIFANSPSYDLIHEYDLKDFKVIHMDLYRIENEDDLESTGFWDLMQQKNSIFFIEWPDLIDPKYITAKRIYDLNISLGPKGNLSRHYQLKLLFS